MDLKAVFSLIRFMKIRTKNRSYKALRPLSGSGSSLEAATKTRVGTDCVCCPFLKVRSLIIVNNVFRIADPAFHISSKKTTSDSGKYPLVNRIYCPLSFNSCIDKGPKTSSGVEKRVIK